MFPENGDTENYIPVCHVKKATFKSSTYTFKPFAAAPSLVDCHSNRNRPFDIFLLMRDTENYSSFLNTATCLLSVSLKTRILSFKKFTVILVAPHRKPRVGKFWLLSSTSAVMPSEVWNTENYGLIHCPFTNRHETALLPYPISNTAPYVSLVLNAIPRTALPYSPEGTTMNVGQLRFI